ncbi:MAG: SCO family protein [Aestuariivirga sp.]
MQISKLIHNRGTLAFLLVLLGEILVLWLLVSGRYLPPFHHQEARPSLIGGSFELEDLNGVKVTERDLAGKYTLLYFGYSQDREMTPTELRVAAAALGLLGPDATRLKTYFVTLDPERDTPEKLKAYLGEISLELSGLTGTLQQVSAMAKAYHVYFRKVPDPKNPQNYEMDYSPLFYLMGPDEKFIKPFTYTTDAKGLAEGLKMVLE